MSTAGTPPEQLLARVLGDLGNTALRLDPLSRARLGPLVGRCARIDVIPPGGGTPRPLTVLIGDAGLVCRAGTEPPPHVILTGTLPDIARQLTGTGGGGVRIEGDESVLTGLADLFGTLQPDLAAPLGNLIGRELADDLVGLAEAGFAMLRSAAESLSIAARRDAADAFVNRDGFEHLLARLEDLRLRVDRLEARTRHLEAGSAGGAR